MRISDWSSDVCSSDLLGLKRDWHFGGAFLQTNVALFRSKYSNVQRQVVDTTTDNPFTVMVNAAEATLQGIELEATFRPIERFTLSGFWGYTDASFDKTTEEPPDGKECEKQGR